MFSTFLIVGGVTLVVSMVVLVMWNGAQPNKSMSQILADLEAKPPR